jgi:2-hydroxychromene-2-carboxylate isomerase
MSLKTLLMPVISQHLLSEQRLLKLRRKAEQARLAAKQPHTLHYFHQADDPYSALAAASLPLLAARYNIDIEPHLVSPPADNAAPDRQRLQAWSRRDASLLAEPHGMSFSDPGRQPDSDALAQHQALLVAAMHAGRFVELANPLSDTLWHSSPANATGIAPVDTQTLARHLAASDAMRQRLGHYLGATFFYAGEWYWGLDRLYHLERRLQSLGALRAGNDTGLLFPPVPDLDRNVRLHQPPPINFFLSLRSPYTAIVAERVFALGRRTGAEVRLRPLLPMVMRGLPVPAEKRRYISQDTAREARSRGIDFGRINDPVGRPVERGMAVLAMATGQGLGEAFVLSFLHGVWADGLDAGSQRGLRLICQRAGLDWADCCAALQDNAWRADAERNRHDLLALGLWGVPSFQVGTLAVWGQDRLWAVQQELLKESA